MEKKGGRKSVGTRINVLIKSTVHEGKEQEWHHGPCSVGACEVVEHILSGSTTV